MVESAGGLLDHVILIFVVAALCTMAAFLIFSRFRITDDKRLWHLAQLGALGGSFPGGFLLIAAAINPDLIDQLREFLLFRLALAIYGVVHLAYIGGKIAEKFKK